MLRGWRLLLRRPRRGGGLVGDLEGRGREGTVEGEGKRERKSTYPFSIRIFMFSIRLIQIRPIQPNNRNCQNEL